MILEVYTVSYKETNINSGQIEDIDFGVCEEVFINKNDATKLLKILYKEKISDLKEEGFKYTTTKDIDSLSINVPDSGDCYEYTINKNFMKMEDNNV